MVARRMPRPRFTRPPASDVERRSLIGFSESRETADGRRSIETASLTGPTRKMISLLEKARVDIVKPARRAPFCSTTIGTKLFIVNCRIAHRVLAVRAAQAAGVVGLPWLTPRRGIGVHRAAQILGVTGLVATLAIRDERR